MSEVSVISFLFYFHKIYLIVTHLEPIFTCLNCFQIWQENNNICIKSMRTLYKTKASNFAVLWQIVFFVVKKTHTIIQGIHKSKCFLKKKQQLLLFEKRMHDTQNNDIYTHHCIYHILFYYKLSINSNCTRTKASQRLHVCNNEV